MKPDGNQRLIFITHIALGIYNLLYWLGKFWGLLPSFFEAVKESWFLLFIIEGMAVASIFVDTIVRWDKFDHSRKRWRIAFTTIFFLAFVLRFIISYMEALFSGNS